MPWLEDLFYGENYEGWACPNVTDFLFSELAGPIWKRKELTKEQIESLVELGKAIEEFKVFVESNKRE